MKKILKTLVLATIGTSILTSCLEEVSPQGYNRVVTEGQAQGAPGAFDNFVANLTNQLSGKALYRGTGSVWDFGYTSLFLTRDVEGQDIVPVGSNNWYTTWYSRVNYLSPGYAVTQLPWTYYYGWIKDCNIVLTMAGANDYAEPIDGRGVGAGNAYALRAMYYLDLCRMYANESFNKTNGDKALTTIKVTESRTIEEARNSERMTWNEAFAFILKDLDAAEKLLANAQATDVYTPSLSFVYGLKARTYLEQQDWANAEKYAKLAQQGHTPMTQDEYLSRTKGFNSPNSSWIFATQFKETDPNIKENDGDSSWGSVMILEGGFDGGYAQTYGGPNVIDRHLYETIPATDFRKNCWVDFRIDAENKATAIESLKAYSNYPERMYASGKGNGYGLGGLSFKFRNKDGLADVKYTAWCVSVPLMRVEEMKLIEIEARGMQNEAEGIALLTSFAKTRDASYVYGNHNESYFNNSTSAFQNEVWWQRRVELWGEGFATFDIKRLNKGIIRSYPNTNHTEGARWNSNKTPNWMTWNFVNSESGYNSGMTINPSPIRPDSDSEPFTF